MDSDERIIAAGMFRNIERVLATAEYNNMIIIAVANAFRIGNGWQYHQVPLARRLTQPVADDDGRLKREIFAVF